MWLAAGAIFFLCKWVMWHRAVSATSSPPPPGACLIFFLAWVGMDPRPFLSARVQPIKVRAFTATAKFIIISVLRILCGLFLVLVAAQGFPRSPIARGWLGMVGIVFMLHFGIFDLLSSFWRRRGYEVEPLMQQPLRATSVSEFWSKRWNTAFNQIAFTLAFRPIARRFGGPAGTMTVFLLSGLVHELVISVPAGGGYGLPTAYFLVQGVGVLLERLLFGGRQPPARPVEEGAGERKSSGHELRRIFTILIVVPAAFILFHPPFIHNVILPMVRAIGGK